MSLRGRPLAERQWLESELVRLYQQGESYKTIAAQIGTSPEAVRHKIIALLKTGQLLKRTVNKEKQGARHNRAKISERDAKRIIMLRLDGLLFREITEAINRELPVGAGISLSNVQSICRGRSWPHLYTERREQLRAISETLKKNGKKPLIRTITPP